MHQTFPLDDLKRVDFIKYEHFFHNFLKQNKLCIFSSALTKHWRSRNEWVRDGKPNFDFLTSAFGEAKAPVANCCRTKFGSQVKEDMSVKDFIKYWKNRASEDQNSQTLYLKDWHFCRIYQIVIKLVAFVGALSAALADYSNYVFSTREFPAYEAYETPVYFKSDWLNEFWDQRSDVTDDYRFVYMGPKGSWTPFHVDVLRSYSWSANICGCKKWLIFPPGQEKYLTDRLGNLAYDITSAEMNDQSQYPSFVKVQPPITVVQHEGEVIFVPSGWHHQVLNLEDTISINHNWTNACGIIKMWEHLKSELIKVQLSIADCKHMEMWDEQCQVILKASCGMNFQEFLDFLTTIAHQRLLTITGEGIRNIEGKKDADTITSLQRTDSPSTVFQDWSRTIKFLEPLENSTLLDYCRFDLQQIHDCLQAMKGFSHVEGKYFLISLEELLKQVKTAVGKCHGPAKAT